MNKRTLARLMAVPADSAGYLLIRAEDETDLADLRRSLSEAIPEANVLTREAMASSDQEMIRQMGVDIIRAMDAVSYAVGLMAIALTIYAATVERSREFGVLKAMGATPLMLMQVVVAQALLVSAAGLVIGDALAMGLGILIPFAYPEMLIMVSAGMLARQVPLILGLSGISAVLPAANILRLDPLMVFKA